MRGVEPAEGKTLMLAGRLPSDPAALDIASLAAAARPGGRVAIDPTGLARMAGTHAVIMEAVRSGKALYGVTTGLGARAGETLDEASLAAFSYQTVRGRAHAVGEALPVDVVRAAMIVRLNTMLLGASGAAPAIAEHIAACLNTGLTPRVGGTASVGAADLILGASMAHALIGEGELFDATGKPGPARAMLSAHGLAEPQLGPRDGLALANHSSFSAAASALAFVLAEDVFECAVLAAGLCLEGFQANLSPWEADVVALRPQAGDIAVAAAFAPLFERSALRTPGRARRLQDPLSLRNILQIFGSARAALDFAKSVVHVEINGSTDNPAVLADRQDAVSTGNYLTPHLTLAVQAVGGAFAALAVAQIARLSKLVSARFSGLPQFLAIDNSISNGFAPVMKVAEALASEIVADAQPVPLWPSINADGVEDVLTNSFLAARRLQRQMENNSRLVALELIIAAQAVDLRQTVGEMGPTLQRLHAIIRDNVELLVDDRPLGADIERLHHHVRSGDLPLRSREG